MSGAIRLFVVAGEPSGDRLGADLVKNLRVTRQVSLSGVGDSALIGEGLASLFPMENLSVMGFADVIKRLPLLLWRTGQIVSAILAAQPDVVVLIDSQVLSQTVAKRLRRRGYGKCIVLYVCPTVWAWKPERAGELALLIDEVFAILPFEPDVMKTLGGPPTSYVGHPTIVQSAFREAIPARGPIVLLPGSRTSEVTRHLPLMQAVAERLKSHSRVTGFVVPTVRSQEARVREAVKNWQAPIEVVAGTGVYPTAIAAVAKMGTVTLELAARGVPMVTIYQAEAGQLSRWDQQKAPFAALPNLLADRELVPELIGLSIEPEKVVSELTWLLDDPAKAVAQLDGFRAIRRRMEQGDPAAPRVDPAERLMEILEAPQRLSIPT
jgi:lipid-A-disaccharide synthase